MSSFLDEFNRIKNQVVTYAGELSSALDFGAGAQNNVQGQQNPEVDFFNGDRVLPSDTQNTILGIDQKYVGYGLGVLAIIVVAAVVTRK